MRAAQQLYDISVPLTVMGASIIRFRSTKGQFCVFEVLNLHNVKLKGFGMYCSCLSCNIRGTVSCISNRIETSTV